jgi:hypothetical protein
LEPSSGEMLLKMQPVIRELAFKFHKGVTTRKLEAEDGKNMSFTFYLKIARARSIKMRATLIWEFTSVQFQVIENQFVLFAYIDISKYY